MVQIPSSGFNKRMSLSVPSGVSRSVNLYGDVAIGEALEGIGAAAVKGITDYTELEERAKASNYIIKKTEEQKSDLLKFQEQAALRMNEEGKVSPLVPDENGALISSPLPILGNIEEGKTLEELTSQAIEKLRIDGQEGASNKFAYDGYTSEMSSVFEQQKLSSISYQRKHIAAQSIKIIDDDNKKVVARAGEYAKQVEIGGIPALQMVEADVLKNIKRINNNTGTNYSLQSAQEAKANLVKEAFTSYISNVEGILRDKSKPLADKTKILKTIQAYINPNNVTFLSGHLDESGYRAGQALLSNYALHVKNQAAQMGTTQIEEFEATLLRTGKADASQAIEGLSNLSEGVTPLEYAQATSRVLIANKAIGVINSFQEQPPYTWDSLIEKALNVPLDKEFVESLPAEIKKSATTENINGVYKSKLLEMYSKRKEIMLKEREEDPAQASFTQIEEGRKAYQTFLEAKGDLSKGGALKDLITTSRKIQTSQMALSPSSQRLLPKSMIKDIASNLDNSGKEFSLSGSIDSYKNVLNSFGKDYFQDFLKQAEADKIKINPAFKTAAYMGDDETIGLMVGLGSSSQDIDKAFKASQKKATNESIRASINAQLVPMLAKMNTNIAGFADTGFSSALLETGVLYAKARISGVNIKNNAGTSFWSNNVEIGSASDIAKDYADIVKRNFKEINFKGGTIIVPANRDHKAIDSYLNKNGGTQGIITKAINTDTIAIPPEFKTDAEKEQFKVQILENGRIKNTGSALRIEYVPGTTKLNPDQPILRKVLMDKFGRPYEIELEAIEKSLEATPVDNKVNKSIIQSVKEKASAIANKLIPKAQAMSDIITPDENLANKIKMSNIKPSSTLDEVIKRETNRMMKQPKGSGEIDLNDPWAL